MATLEEEQAVPSGDESEINGGAAGAGEGDLGNTPDAAPAGVTPPGLEGANLLNEFKKELSDLREDMKRKDMEIKELRRLIAENEKDKKEVEENGITKIKGFDSKTMPTPQKYDLERKEDEEWFNLFTSTMVAMDPVWDKILEQIMLDNEGKKIKKELKQKDIKGIHKRLGIKEDIEKATNKMLFVNLLEYTKGDAHAKVKAHGTDGAFEAFRYIATKGKNASVTHKMAMRTKAMNPDQAKTAKEVEKRINEWKSSLRYLSEIGDNSIDDDLKKTTLIKILPEMIAEHVIQRYDEDDNYDEMEQFVMDYLERLEGRSTEMSRRTLGAITEGGEDAKDDRGETDWSYHYHWDDNYGYICTASPAPKKRKTEDGASEEPDQRDSPESKGKGKGKGPKGGCHECGGDHYVRECPIRAAKGKSKGGKGKGKNWDYVPQKPWSLYNPGFRQTQWNDWRPKGKGKGGFKGKGQTFGGQPGVQLVYPPLGNVSSGGQWQEECNQGGWQDTSSSSGLWIGQVSKVIKSEQNEQKEYKDVTRRKVARYRNTTEFDEALHRAKAYAERVKPPQLRCESKEVELGIADGPHPEFKLCTPAGPYPEFKLCTATGPHPEGKLCTSTCALPLASLPTGVSILRKQLKPALKQETDDEAFGGLARVPAQRKPAEDASAKVDFQNTEGKIKYLRMLMKLKTDRLGAVNGAAETAHLEAKWRRLEVAVDSGACDSVINPDDLPDHPVRETVASMNGEQYASATGDPIPNMGEISALMLTREETMRAMNFTAAPLAKPLAAVKKMCAAGHTVVFDDEGSYVYNKYTGEVNAMCEELGNYIMDVWVPPPGWQPNQGFGRQLP